MSSDLDWRVAERRKRVIYDWIGVTMAILAVGAVVAVYVIGS